MDRAEARNAVKELSFSYRLDSDEKEEIENLLVQKIGCVPQDLFIEVLDKYRNSEEEVIWEYSSHIDTDLKNLKGEVAEYKRRAGLEVDA